MAYLKEQGGTVSLRLCRLSQEVVEWLGIHSISIGKVHSWQYGHFGKSLKLSRSDNSHRVVSSSLSVQGHLQGVWSSSNQSLRNLSQHKTSQPRVTSSGSFSVEEWYPSAPLGQSEYVCICCIHSALSASVKGSSVLESPRDSGSPIVAAEGVVTRLSGTMIKEPLKLPRLWNLLVQLLMMKFCWGLESHWFHV